MQHTDRIARRFLGMLALIAIGFLATPAAAQLEVDFDTTGPLSNAELDDWFDFLGVEADVWFREPNTQNEANGSFALHNASDGGAGGAVPFSRVAVFKDTVFQAVNAEITVALTYDRGINNELDADDNAGVYLRFVDEENFYYLDFNAGGFGGPSTNAVDLWRRKSGVDTMLADNLASPTPVEEEATITVTFRAVGTELFGFVDGAPIPGIDPFVDDTDPLVDAGRVGVGQHTNPLFADDFTLTSFDEPLLLPTEVVAATVDTSVDMLMVVGGACNADQDVTYSIDANPAGVASVTAAQFVAGGTNVTTVEATILGVGTATLTATAEAGAPAPCTAAPPATITVQDIDVGGLELNLAASMATFEPPQQSLVSGVFGAAGVRNLTGQADYQSDNEDVLTVDANGLVTAVAPGIAQVTASFNGETDTQSILVVSARPADFFPVNRGLQALYTFRDGPGSTIIRDRSGIDPPLDLIISDLSVIEWLPDQGVMRIIDDTTNPPGPIATEGPATRLLNAASATSELTIEAWVAPARTDNTITGPGRIVSYSGNAGNRNFTMAQTADVYQMRLRTDGSRTNNGCPCNFDAGPSTAVAGQLAHLVFTFNPAEDIGTWYIDGVEVAVDDQNFDGNLSNWNPSYRLMLANEDNQPNLASRDWRGDYHKVAIYNRTFTAGEVLENFNGGASGCPPVNVASHFTPDAINVAAVDLPAQVQIDVAIPSVASGLVTVTSSDPGVAGAAQASFAEFTTALCGATVLTIEGVGSTMLNLTNDMGFANGAGKPLNVIELQSLNLQVSGAVGVGEALPTLLFGDFGAAGARNLTGSAAGTTYASSDEAVFTVDADGVVAAVGFGTAELTATNSGQSVTAAITVVAAPTRITFLVGDLNLGEGDLAVVAHLNALRFDGDPPAVVPVDDDAFDPNVVEAQSDLLITSSTIDPDKVTGQFGCLSVPHIFWEQRLSRAADEGLADAGVTGGPFEDIFILNNSHPITQGLGLTVDEFAVVYDAGQTVSFSNGLLAPGAVALAESGVFAGDVGIIAAETGGLRIGGQSSFPARRVFLWFHDETFDNLNGTGLAIFNNAVDWALTGNRLAPNTLAVSAPAQMQVGTCVQLSVRLSNPENEGCAADVTSGIGTTYESSDEAIATVSGDGLVRGLVPGTVTITARQGGLQGSAQIVVGDVVGRVTDRLMALYEFQEGQGIRVGDTSGVDPPLGLTIRDPSLVNWIPGGGLEVAVPSPPIASNEAATKIINASRASNEITIEALLTPADLMQGGPARIVSCSFDGSNRNFSLLQSDDVWEIRLRTSTSGNNGTTGTDRQTPAGTATTNRHHVVFTRNAAGEARIYVDGELSKVATGFGGDFSNWDPSYLFMIGNEATGGSTDPVDARDWRGIFHRVAIYSKALSAEEVRLNFGIATPCPGPAPTLVQIADGLGATANTFISPLGEDVPLTEVGLEASEPLTLNGQTATYTGAGTVPVAALVDNGGGLHTVQLDPAPEPGEWLKLDLDVTGAGGGQATLVIFVSHQPLDVNQDQMTNIRDATAFGDVFRGNRALQLIDINGDGVINVRDATAFGDNWNGIGDLRAWRNSSLPAPPE